MIAEDRFEDTLRLDNQVVKVLIFAIEDYAAPVRTVSDPDVRSEARKLAIRLTWTARTVIKDMVRVRTKREFLRRTGQERPTVFVRNARRGFSLDRLRQGSQRRQQRPQPPSPFVKLRLGGRNAHRRSNGSAERKSVRQSRRRLRRYVARRYAQNLDDALILIDLNVRRIAFLDRPFAFKVQLVKLRSPYRRPRIARAEGLRL
jgi:hypothetical protein